MRLPLMSEEASTVMLIHPAPGASAKNRLKGEDKEGRRAPAYLVLPL